MIAPMSELRDVSKSYGQGRTRVEALRNVSLEIYAGELTLIEGPSGSGKTTLLHVLGLLQRADAGEVWIRGRRLDGLAEPRLVGPRRENVVLIFQGANLLESLTVKDNVGIASRLCSGGRSSAEPMECVARLGLTNRANHLPRELSGGEKQRTAIARALACPGLLVLADEPTANLDWGTARPVIQRLAELGGSYGLDGRLSTRIKQALQSQPSAIVERSISDHVARTMQSR